MHEFESLSDHLEFQLPKIKFEKYNVIMPTAEEDEPKNVKNAEANDITVRGRVFDQTKPETFNQVSAVTKIKEFEIQTRCFTVVDMRRAKTFGRAAYRISTRAD